MTDQSSSSLYWREIDVACRVAQEAGKIILNLYNQNISISYKAGDEPVTEADQKASDHILEQLKLEFPNDIFISEEEPDDPRRQTAPRVWFIDPLDGTKEFIARNGEFSVMIGLVVDAEPVLGVVYQPTADRLWWGAHKEAFLRDKSVQITLHVSTINEYALMRMLVSRSHRNEIVDQMATRLGITREIISGSGGIKLGLLAGGHADVYFSPTPYSKLWDLCGPEAILRAAGGQVTDLLGHRLTYTGDELFNLNGVLASNGTRHQDIVKRLSGLFP